MKHFVTGIKADASTFGQLRSLLDETERRIVIMHETPGGARDIIQNVERIGRLLEALDSPLYDTRAEESRAEALRERLVREAVRVERLVRVNGHADELASSPLWQTVRATAIAQRQRTRRRWIVGGTALTVVAVLLFVVLPWLFPPPPQAETTQIMNQAADGDYTGALALAEAERARVPTDPQGALWAGALYLRQGNTAAAENAWQAARQLYDNDVNFYFERGTVLGFIGAYDAAEQDAQQLIDLPDGAPFGYYLRAHLAESRGAYAEAIPAFEQAANLADQANLTQLAVTARTRLGFLLRSGPPPPSEVP